MILRKLKIFISYIEISWPYLSSYKRLMCLNLVLLVVAAAFESFGLGMLVPTLQSLQSTQEKNFFSTSAQKVFAHLGLEFNFLNLILCFSIMIMTKYALVMLQQHYTTFFSTAVGLNLRKKATKSTFNAALGYSYNKKIGDTVSTLYISAGNAGGSLEYLLLFIKSLIFTTAYIILATKLSWQLSLLVIIVVTIAYFIISSRFKKSRHYGEREKELIDGCLSMLNDRLSGLGVVKSYNAENRVTADLTRLYSSYRNNVINSTDNKIIAYAFFEPFLFLVMVCILILAIQVFQLHLTIVMVALLVFLQIIPQLKSLNTNLISIIETVPHFIKVHECITSGDLNTLTDGTMNFDQIKEQIRFEKLSFRYSNNSPIILSDVSLAIPARRTIALIGMSGGGKTTIINLLLRHYDPFEGKITVDGIDLRRLKISEWKRKIALVDQDAYLFNDTVSNNIKFGNPEASDEEVIEAAKLAHAHTFISSMPQEYNTLIGHRGVSLSGGQRQRIALARALIRKPQILLLDEATSALDSESEHLIQESMKLLKGKVTMVVIAHRLSTIREADMIVLIENGAIAEAGTHQELYEKKSRYFKYLSLQT